MLIIAGHLVVNPAERDTYVAGAVDVVRAALAAPGCMAFALTADTVDLGRVQVFERWEDEASLLAFRGSGPSGDQQTAILDADVRRFEIASVGEA